MAEQKLKKRRLTGIVVSTKGNKTAIVTVERLLVHPVYGKRYKRNKKFPVHDEENKTKVGDRVVFEECRPISKTKHWKIVEI